jgi:cytochrome c-type biogenesis protein CcmE
MTSTRRVVVVVAVVLGAIAFLVAKGLGDATVFFKTADEAVADKAELGHRRFRVEGLVTEPVTQRGDTVDFSIVSAGVCVAVRHAGDPPELFKPGIPVVLEGRWQGEVYESDRILVKHTSEYREKNPDRLDRAAGEPTISCPHHQ